MGKTDGIEQGGREEAEGGGVFVDAEGEEERRGDVWGANSAVGAWLP